MITVAEARSRILRDAAPGPVEPTTLLRALGKVLAEPVMAPLGLPPFDNSAMDGFAVRSQELAGVAAAGAVDLPVSMEVVAGCGRFRELAPGTACRIMTGGPIPPGADAVVPVEEAWEEAGRVTFRKAVSPGTHIRRAGEDFQAGDRLLEPGMVLTPARIALLAGVGMVEVKVHAAPRVAILTSGDELVPPGQALRPGQIYDSNAYAMAAMVSEAGGIPVRMGVIRDERDATWRQLADAASYDVILTSGGVSMGRYDFIGEILQRHGDLHFDRVAQQPGKPFTYATLGGKPVFALPGNPVSTLVCFEVYVRPVIRRMSGLREIDRPRVWARMGETFAKKPGRQAFLRAILERTPDGVMARLAGAQGSAILSAMARANALVIVPAEASGLAEGEQVEALALDSWN
ncbi:Molybdopterin molybdenumtransferase [compost metagenome]